MWKKISEDSVIARMSQSELERYKSSANWEADPIQILIDETAAYIRDLMRTNGNIRLSPDEHELPEGIIGKACDYLIYDIVVRLGGTATEERKLKREEAEKYFERISRRWVTVESWGAPTDKNTAGAGIEIVKASHHRLTPENLENL